MQAIHHADHGELAVVGEVEVHIALSRRVRRPGLPEVSGCLRVRAVAPVFWSIDNTIALSGQVR
jgi:hypothetical protein